MNILKKYKRLPKDSRNLLKIGILVALFVALPLFVWALVSQNFDLRNRAATAESPSTQPIVCNYSINPPKACPQGYYCHQTNDMVVGANGVCIKDPTEPIVCNYSINPPKTCPQGYYCHQTNDMVVGANGVCIKDTTPYEKSCPTPRPFEGVCTQVISFALNPTNYTCCQYPNPCSVPSNWNKYTSNSLCVKAICEKKFSGNPSDSVYERQACTKAGGKVYCGNGWCSCSCSTSTFHPTPTPYRTHTPYPTGTQYRRPTPTPYRTYYPSPRPTGEPRPPTPPPGDIVWEQVFIIRFKLTGVFDGSANQPEVSIRFNNPSTGFNYTTANPIAARYINNGVYEATFTVRSSPSGAPAIPVDNRYIVYIKGEKHISEKFCQANSQISRCTGSGQISITAVPNVSIDYIHNFDFTGLPLEPGDLYPQDGKADINDFAKIKTVMGKMCENQTADDLKTADLDYSGCVNIMDAFLMRKTLEVRYDEN